MVTLVFGFIVAAKIGYFQVPKMRKFINVGTWIMFGYFLFNIFGNSFSSSLTEMVVFTPISLAMSVFALRLAVERP
jgi:hypothetical protein